ncbi:ret finger protein-like 4A [Phyllostomus discolor]|uniref:Ret finger protein-like 4A n=1 Tax=Phyllostomus discolor TaxID=89673 RepID=A0A6J2MZQ1_9CHIR|nr:ret finger protein-like 4A [Phyllostomus discolor]
MAQHFKDTSSCYICLTYMANPVSLKCGFICCLKCVNSLPRGPGGQGVMCLTCSEVSQKSDIRPKSQLARLVSEVRVLEPQLRAILRMNPRMRRFQVDVTLDVDTANNHLYISEDRRQVRCVYEEQKRRVCPERFSASFCVLGSPRLTSGRHYWEVDVGTSTEWNLGVCKESVPRHEEVDLSSERGFWTMSCREKERFLASTRPLTVLMVSPGLNRVGVFLDLEMGTISFYHVGDGTHIFTFPPISVAEPLRPFFAPGTPAKDGGSFMTLCPGFSPSVASAAGQGYGALSTAGTDAPCVPTAMDTSPSDADPAP